MDVQALPGDVSLEGPGGAQAAGALQPAASRNILTRTSKSVPSQ